MSVELFIVTCASGFTTAGVFTVSAELGAFVCANMPSAASFFSTNEKAPTDESGAALYDGLQESINRIKSSSRDMVGRCVDKNALMYITDKNAHNKINNRADFKFIVITEVFFKKINSFHLIYIDLFGNLCDNILVMMCSAHSDCYFMRLIRPR